MAKGSNGKKGQQPFEATPEERNRVEVLSGLGLTRDEIGIALGISDVTLTKYFPEELRRGGIKADANVMTNLYKMATGNGPEAGKCAIFWAKVRRRWHEVQRVIHGFEPEAVSGFVRQIAMVLRKELPNYCPHCKTALDFRPRISAQLRQIAQKMTDSLPPSEIVPKPAELEG